MLTGIVVEWDELRELPLVDTAVREAPARPAVALPAPVGEAAFTGAVGEIRERASLWLPALVGPPDVLEEVGDAVVGVVCVEAAARERVSDEVLNVGDVAQRPNTIERTHQLRGNCRYQGGRSRSWMPRLPPRN